jgi:hypothetical protein
VPSWSQCSSPATHRQQRHPGSHASFTGTTEPNRLRADSTDWWTPKVGRPSVSRRKVTTSRPEGRSISSPKATILPRSSTLTSANRVADAVLTPVFVRVCEEMSYRAGRLTRTLRSPGLPNTPDMLHIAPGAGRPCPATTTTSSPPAARRSHRGSPHPPTRPHIRQRSPLAPGQPLFSHAPSVGCPPTCGEGVARYAHTPRIAHLLRR